MCGRFTLNLAPAVLQEWFDIIEGVDYPPRFNIAPTQPVIVIADQEKLRRAILMRWGLVPMWVKDPREFPLIINARTETLPEKPAFKGGLRHHRCIIPASGYYEWRKGADGKKQPYYITLKDSEPMAFAGVYSTWMGPDGEEIDTTAIITLSANKDIRHIHERMPALIGKSQIDDWLNVRGMNEKEAYAMLRALPEGKLDWHPVSTRVNSVQNDDLHLLDVVSEARPETPKKPVSKQMDLF